MKEKLIIACLLEFYDQNTEKVWSKTDMICTTLTFSTQLVGALLVHTEYYGLKARSREIYKICYIEILHLRL